MGAGWLLGQVALAGLTEQPWFDAALAGVCALGGVLLAALVHLAVVPLLLRLAHKTPSDLDNRLARAVRWPISIGISLIGFYLAARLPLDADAPQLGLVDDVFASAGIMTGASIIGQALVAGMDWYSEAWLSRATRGTITHLFRLLRRVAFVLVYGLGALLVLDRLGIPINPLLTSLGLGGLAVALAIQPTLANLFAGTYVLTEGVISPGDYIAMEGGVAGYVIEVSWRSTRIRTWENNLIVIPNSRFAETILTNYNEPEPPVNVYLTCGVSYESDLRRVEQTAREVMEQLIAADPNGVQEYGAWFGFESFGDSNVNFWLFIQAKDRLATFELQSALIRDLHARFEEEGIVINYPVRVLHLPPGITPPGFDAKAQ